MNNKDPLEKYKRLVANNKVPKIGVDEENGSFQVDWGESTEDLEDLDEMPIVFTDEDADSLKITQTGISYRLSYRTHFVIAQSLDRGKIENLRALLLQGVEEGVARKKIGFTFRHRKKRGVNSKIGGLKNDI